MRAGPSKTNGWRPACLLGAALLIAICGPPVLAQHGGGGGGGGGHPPDGEAGNNLSFPVIWADRVAKTLPGIPGMEPVLIGEWWYQWGTNGVDPDVTPASGPPDPDQTDENLDLIDDGVPGTVDVEKLAGVPPADNPLPLVRAYVQKDPGNLWQAESITPRPDVEVKVDLIDWGDNLESVDWYTNSQVRTEVVLIEDEMEGDVEDYRTEGATFPMLEYEMRHTSGWGIDEVHGLAASPADWHEFPVPSVKLATRATVYSHCARLTIQKLLVDRDDPALVNLVWNPDIGLWENETLVRPPVFNKAVHEGGDGPGYYSAEINVKGKVIYGYTWNVRRDGDMTDGTMAGDYRITFSFDKTVSGTTLNTFFADGVTQLLVPTEEEQLEAYLDATGEEPGGGGIAVLDCQNNLTYIDIRILERGGGGGGGGYGGGGGGGR